jgi:hypothetical protein
MTDTLEIKDFSGGVTDYPLNADLKKCEILDNLLLESQASVARPAIRPGSTLSDGLNSRIPEGNQRVADLLKLSDYIVTHTSKKLYYQGVGTTPSAFTNTSINGSDQFKRSDANTTAVNTRVTNGAHLYATSSYDNPALLWKDGTAIKSVTAGLPKPPSVRTNLSSIVSGALGGGGTPVTFLCRIVLRYDFVVDGKSFSFYSEPSDIISAVREIGGTIIFESSPSSITLDNSFTNFDFLNCKVECYSTLGNGTVFYYVGESALTLDTAPDKYDFASVSFNYTALNTVVPDFSTNKKLYTTGGIYPNTLPPRASVVHTNGDLTYYADIKESDSPERYNRNTLYQSLPGIGWSAPPTFYATISDDIVGVSSAMSVTVVVCKNSAYRVEGSFDSFGRGGMLLQRISDTASCISAQSMVQTDEGLFWAGEDGVYFTDGYRVRRINQDYDETWRKFVANTSAAFSGSVKRIIGKFDRMNRRVYWTVKRKTDAQGSTDTDCLYVLDLNFGLSDTASFTTISGGYDAVDSFTAFSCTAIEFDNKNGYMFRGDSRGFLHKHVVSTHGGFTPVYTDTYFESKHNGTITNNVAKSVLPTLQTIAYDFGSTSLRKYIPKCSFIFENNDTSLPYFLDVLSINDKGRTSGLLDRIKIDGSDVAGSSIFISKWRHFVRSTLRCIYKQLKIFVPQVQLNSSATSGVLVTNSGSQVIRASGSWAETYVVGSGKVYFSDDNYTTGYLITDVSGGVLTVSGTPPAGAGKQWRLFGNTQLQRFGLASYTINFSMLGDKTEAYASSEAAT